MSLKSNARKNARRNVATKAMALAASVKQPIILKACEMPFSRAAKRKILAEAKANQNRYGRGLSNPSVIL